MGFEPIKETIRRSSRRGPIRSALLALNVEKEAGKILPPWAKMRSFREGRLRLSVPSSAHAQELFLHALELRKKLNASLGGKFVEKISFRVGS